MCFPSKEDMVVSNFLLSMGSDGPQGPGAILFYVSARKKKKKKHSCLFCLFAGVLLAAENFRQLLVTTMKCMYHVCIKYV